VALSLIAASKGWAKRWAPKEIKPAAEMWNKWVLGGKVAQQYQGRYMEVRYEQLLENTEEIVKSVFDFIGLSTDMSEIKAIVEDHHLSKMRKKQVDGETLYKAKGFFRKGKSGEWRTSMGLRQRYQYDRIAGDLLKEIGYADHLWWSNNSVDRLTAPITFFGENRIKRMKQVVRALKRLVSFG
jgi:hypothetical protein